MVPHSMKMKKKKQQHSNNTVWGIQSKAEAFNCIVHFLIAIPLVATYKYFIVFFFLSSFWSFFFSLITLMKRKIYKIKLCCKKLPKYG